MQLFWGAISAAIVALMSLAFNYRSTLQSQRDTQFYEALKRFGDEDSHILRSTAAGLLAQMGTKRVISFRQRRPYQDTALTQLLEGFLSRRGPTTSGTPAKCDMATSSISTD